MVLTRTQFRKEMTTPSKRKSKRKKIPKQYLAGTSGKLRAKRKAALKRLNKNNKGSKNKSKQNKKFRRMYG